MTTTTVVVVAAMTTTTTTTTTIIRSYKLRSHVRRDVCGEVNFCFAAHYSSFQFPAVLQSQILKNLGHPPQ